MISITIPYNQEVDCVHCVYRIPATMYRQWPPGPLYCLPGEHNFQFYVPCICTCICIFIGSGLLALFIVYQVNKISIKTRNLRWMQHYFSGGAQQYSSLHHNRLENNFIFLIETTKLSLGPVLLGGGIITLLCSVEVINWIWTSTMHYGKKMFVAYLTA